MAETLELDILTPQGRLDLRQGDGDKAGAKGPVQAVEVEGVFEVR